MRVIVLVLGASGRTGSFVAAHLFAADNTVFALLADPNRSGEVARLGRMSNPNAGAGVQPVVADLLGDPAELDSAMRGCDAVVNAAGSRDLTSQGPSVDREGVIAAIESAKRSGVRRFIQISAMYADRPEQGPEQLRNVLEAKRDADTALVRSGLEWTVIRPGGLADSVLTGQIEVGRRLDHPGAVAREDIAAVAATCLVMPSTVGLAFDVVAGQTPILQALAELTPIHD